MTAPRPPRGDDDLRVGGTPEAAPLDDLLAEFERKAIRDALHRAGGQRSLAARLLRISRSRLYRRMDALGIGPKSDRSG